MVEMVLKDFDHIAAVVAIVQWIGPGVVLVSVHFIRAHPKVKAVTDKLRRKD